MNAIVQSHGVSDTVTELIFAPPPPPFPVVSQPLALSFVRLSAQELELQLSEQRGLTQAIALHGSRARLHDPAPGERSQPSPW